MGKYLQIKEIGKVITGKTPSTEDASNFDGKYPFITPSDIKSFDEKYLLETERTLSEKGIKKLKNNILPKEAICFVCIGSTIGKMCLTNTIAYSNQQINSLIVNNNFDAHYMFYFLRYIKSYFQQLGAGAGSGKGIVNKTTFENSKVKVETNKNIQVKIADILSTYDNLIENNNKRIRLLEQMAENIYKEWFVRFRFPGYEDVDFENGIPKEWEYTKLEKLANISTGKCNREDAEEDGAYPLFDRSQEIKRSNVWLKDCEAIIVPGEGTSFIPRYYSGKFNLHQRCYCVEPLEKGMGFFLYQTLMMYRIYFLYVATGATVPSLRLNNFNDFKVLLPKKELRFQYNEIAEKMNDEILLLENKNELLGKQRDMILPRLMSGKLEV